MSAYASATCRRMLQFTVVLPVLLYLSLSVCLLPFFAHITKLAAIICTLPNKFALLTLNLLLLLLHTHKHTLANIKVSFEGQHMFCKQHGAT